MKLTYLLKNNETWTLVRKAENVRLIDSQWMFQIKRNENGDIIKCKARLVEKGFMQREGLDYEETYVPCS